MGHPDKESLSSSSYWKQEDKYSANGDGRGGVGPSNNHFSFQKVDFVTDRHDGVSCSYKSSLTEYHMASSWSNDYSIYDTVGYSFGVADGDGKGGVGPRTTHLS